MSTSLLLKDILDNGRVRAADGTVLPLDSHISREGGEMLQALIAEIDARTTLEIGLAFGVSALFICAALSERPGARHVVIDPGQNGKHWRGVGLHHLSLTGLNRFVDFRELPSHLAMGDLEREGFQCDLALVDGCHTFDYVMIDMFLVDRVLRLGGVMFVDDAEWTSVRQACRYFITNRGYKVMRCCNSEPKRRSVVRQLVSAVARRWPAIGSRLKAEWVIRDEDIGLAPNCRCVALEKTADDTRKSFEHARF
jgi:predicted O-methyltransferase YrrM